MPESDGSRSEALCFDAEADEQGDATKTGRHDLPGLIVISICILAAIVLPVVFRNGGVTADGELVAVWLIGSAFGIVAVPLASAVFLFIATTGTAPLRKRIVFVVLLGNLVLLPLLWKVLWQCVSYAAG